VTPRYDQITLDETKMKNQLHQILSPSVDDDGVWIHQNAWFHLGEFEIGKTFEYNLKDKNNGVYVFLIDGQLTANDQILDRRDGFGMWETESVCFETKTASKLLLMEVPMIV
jgi:redox-sensitive bicupin YhaK (pirin superfamily)